MLLVSTCLKPSAIHGIGLFANKFIPKGALVWEYNSLLDRTLSLAEILALPADVQERLAVYMYEDPKNPAHYVWCGDDGRYMNHSETPNLVDIDGCDYAAEDIPAGTEITTNYACFGAEVAPNDWQAEAIRYAHLFRAKSNGDHHIRGLL